MKAPELHHFVMHALIPAAQTQRHQFCCDIRLGVVTGENAAC